jgi:hypothetical protein
MKHRRRTKKLYKDLHDNPTILFPGDTDKSAPIETILFPNGQDEIWLQAPDGRLGIAIQASIGPHGLGVRIRSFIGTPKISIMAPTEGTLEDSWVELCQYKPTPEANEYKAWYRKDSKETGG